MLTIKTNNQPRYLFAWYELPDAVRFANSMDMPEESEACDLKYFIYKGILYNIDDFMRCEYSGPFDVAGWHGVHHSSYWDGALIRLCENGESVIVGRYIETNK